MVKEVTRHIKHEDQRELWARAAGRCQFDGCNKIVYQSPLTKEAVNIGQQAHIYSFSEDGPRGWGIFKSNKQIEEYINKQSKINFNKVFDQYLRTTQIPTLEYKLDGYKLQYRYTNCIKYF